jgi:carbamoyltransferase
MPFFEFLKKKKLEVYSRKFNKEIKFIPHHRCHAEVARLFSPYEDAVILVMDGAGSELIPGEHEEFSIFELKDGNLRFLENKLQKFERYQDKWLSDGMGIFYETCADYVFGSSEASGKLMGLAPFGVAIDVQDRLFYLKNLDWKGAFKKGSKADWENSIHLTHYQNIAATAQLEFEKNLFSILENIRMNYSQINNLILTGGCALNCTSNMKIIDKGYFQNVYVPPFPGDESISLGAVITAIKPEQVKVRSWDLQTSYWGAKTSVPNEIVVDKLFSNYTVSRPENLGLEVARLLNSGNIVAWFQGRSECGPRALGNRSILASPFVKGIKGILNSDIKFRENFRPYGSSVTWEDAHKYFQVACGFDNSFMSFATKVRNEFTEQFKEIVHIDNSSRMQTVRVEQNKVFYDLLKNFEQLSGFPILLNTSLNIMGEPIVETTEDLYRFFYQSKISYCICGTMLVKK